MKTPSLLDIFKSSNGNNGNGAKETAVRYALAYLRVSTEEQNEEAQRADVERYAAQNGITVLEWYRDHAKSASSDHENRSAFWGMVERAKSDDRVSLLLCWDESRFMRDRLQATIVKSELQTHGVKVIPVTHPYDSETIDGVLLESLHQALAQIEAMKIRERVVMGMRHNCQQRDPETGWLYKNGGRTPYGYKAVRVERGADLRGLPKYKQIWVKDETIEAGRPRWEWVRVILLDWYVGKKLSDKQIVRRLNEFGVTPQDGGEGWSYVTLHYLKQPEKLLTYTGYYIWGKYSRRDKAGQRKGKNRREPDEWEYVPNAHEAILTMEEAEIVQAEAERRRKPRKGGGERRTQDSPFLLSGGLAKCGRCGSHLVGHFKNGGRRKRLDYYVCTLSDRSGGSKCGRAYNLPSGLIHTVVWDFITHHFPSSDATVKELMRRFNARIAEVCGRPDAVKDDLERKLQGIEKSKERLREAFRKGADPLWVADESKRLREEEEETRRQLTVRAQPIKRPTITEDTVRQWYAEMRETMEHGNVEQRRRVIRAFVKGVTLYPDTEEVTVEFYNERCAEHLVAEEGLEPPTRGL